MRCKVQRPALAFLRTEQRSADLRQRRLGVEHLQLKRFSANQLGSDGGMELVERLEKDGYEGWR